MSIDRAEKKYEYSAGGVVFTESEGEIKYVIITSYRGFVGFPKGHIEAGETEEAAAIREIFEEVGLRVELLPGFRIEDEYPLPNKPDTIKRVVYFVAHYDGSQAIRYQKEELSGAALMTLDEAMAAFRHKTQRKILRSADDFVRKIAK